MPDTPSLPASLFHTGRAQCPDCGAALRLTDYGALIRCEFCGGTAVVERRLRTIEPILSDGFITADAPLDMARDTKPSQVINAVAQDESHCPTCGTELEMAEIQAIRTCKYCGTQSKIERRLLRSPDADAALDAREKNADKAVLRQFRATEKLIDIVESKIDLAIRVRAGWELGEMWSHVNARAARLLPRVLEVLRTCEPELEIHLAELVGKLLCNDDLVLSNAVLRAAEKFTFDVNGSQALLRNLSLGSGVGLKLLLDTADYAGSQGAMDYACSALWAVNTMIDRNYTGRLRLAEIVLYRLLYLKGPVQAWAIELVKGHMGLGCRFPTATILHFIDDCAAERPELIPHITEAFYDGQAAQEVDYIARLTLLDQLLTVPAKIAALDHLYAPPESASKKTIGDALKKLIGLMENPALGPAAIHAIADWISDENPQPRPCIEEMIGNIGDKLPAQIRRAWFRKLPDTTLLSPMAPDYSWPAPPKPTAFDEQLKQWMQVWDTGIRQSVARQDSRQKIAREYWNELRSNQSS